MCCTGHMAKKVEAKVDHRATKSIIPNKLTLLITLHLAHRLITLLNGNCACEGETAG